ncbi:hypothetical protein BLNAU_9506 [Blattamonas nauphoetae]|uniref:Uncharacterized protein n=1 Tax=Blattamonas nauphoetae TaxID=2049346 RepID=A0ABQ9WYD2_9EUKA|nr:hypothetical protein BLNAU_22057 [Blattamonas nauphoetae]KAK2955459.1 hypothetical protein BLNAU_9506 [Blattamonas nauphoetae]
MTVPSPSFGQSPHVTTPTLKLIPNRNNIATFQIFSPSTTSLPPKRGNSLTALATSIPTISTEIHFNNTNIVVLTNTNAPFRTTTSSADDKDIESSLNRDSSGGSGGLDSHDEFKEMKT